MKKVFSILILTFACNGLAMDGAISGGGGKVVVRNGEMPTYAHDASKFALSNIVDLNALQSNTTGRWRHVHT